jgi:hypothetical protein
VTDQAHSVRALNRRGFFGLLSVLPIAGAAVVPAGTASLKPRPEDAFTWRQVAWKEDGHSYYRPSFADHDGCWWKRI